MHRPVDENIRPIATNSLPSRLVLALLGTAVVLSVLVALGMRFLNEDLFVSLVAGRDVANGRIAQPDTWSFTTNGAVWINQAWFSHYLLYLSYRAGQALGPVLVQAALLGLTVLASYAQCRAIGASRDASLLALSLGVLAIAPFLQIRPENFGLLCFVLVSGLVSASPARGARRMIAALLVLLFWLNSHGSYVLFFMVLGLKILALLALDSRMPFLAKLIDALVPPANGRDLRTSVLTDPVRRKELIGWTATGFAGLGLAAVANPYGIANLLMPHRQLSAGSMTHVSADWLPLLHWDSLIAIPFFGPTDVTPYLLLLGILLVLVGSMPFLLGRKRIGTTAQGAVNQTMGHDTLLPFLVPVMLIPASFSFRRMILFAGIALIPPLAALLHAAASGSAELLRRRFGPASGWHVAVLSLGLAGVWLLGVVWVFVSSTLPPYLPGNPMLVDRPVVRQLMSFDGYDQNIVHFMKTNKLQGRLFTGWVISDFILFHVPEVSVFMDCRDQSAYSDEVIRTYFSMLEPHSRQTSPERMLEILDQYRVQGVLLAKNPKEFRVASLLLQTRQWACLYSDEQVFYLVRADDPRFSAHLKRGSLPPLWYPDDRIRIQSAAVLEFFMTGKLSDVLREQLKELLKARPAANLYGLLSLSSRDDQNCLSDATRDFFLAEVRRLTALNLGDAQLSRPRLESMIRLLKMLQTNDRRCARAGPALPYAALLRELEKNLENLERQYLGHTPL